MIVKPLHERRRTLPVAFVLDADPLRGILFATSDALRFIDADELRDYDGAVYLFCRPSRILAATDARQWTGYTWSGGYNKLVLDGGPICYPFGNVVKGIPAENAVEQAYSLFRWLGSKAIIPGSISSMTWRLWRTTLDTPVSLSRRRLLGDKAFYGGRQEAPYPGDYRNCKYFDMTAAYPTAMADAPYPATFCNNGTEIGEGVGIARASVLVPRMEWSPLPVRVHRNALCYGWGTATGFWPWSDLRLALDTGCTVEVLESYAGVGELDLFGEWWSVVKDARQNVPLSKAVTSRLWGAFALSQSTGYMVRFLDEEGRQKVRTPLQNRGRSLPTAPYIAAETAARVRSRLYREGIAGTKDVLYVDTDAIITGGKISPDNCGTAPGQWRVKATMSRCEIRGPQCFRHECPTCNRDHVRWHYTVAGASTPDIAVAVFNRTGRNPGTAWTPGEMTLPRGPIERYRNVRHSLSTVGGQTHR